jgi:hypothetical protein
MLWCVWSVTPLPRGKGKNTTEAGGEEVKSCVSGCSVLTRTLAFKRPAMIHEGRQVRRISHAYSHLDYTDQTAYHLTIVKDSLKYNRITETPKRSYEIS